MNGVAEQQLGIYSFILQEETNYRTQRVPLSTNWRDWNMSEHIDRSFTLKNSRFYLGVQDYTRPFNNIILPIANVAYRSEGFDVKDAQIYVDNSENYHKSFLARKFHNWWAKDNKIDQAIDESVVSYWDYGLTVVKNVNDARPEIVDLQDIAFCDQTDFMAGPKCLQHFFSISELQEMRGKWKASEVDKTILMARFKREDNQTDGDETSTPGKYVKIYELEGMFPESWLGAEKMGSDWEDTGKYTLQTHFVTFYTNPNDGMRYGVTLFKGKRAKTIFKALKRNPIHGRACGRGGIEELFHPQIWTNYSELQVKEMLETTSKVLFKTNKKKVVQLNNWKNMKQGQILDLDGDGTLEQLVIQPINKTAFDNFTNKWEQIGRTIGSASDPQLGLNPTSGTPLGTTEIVTQQGVGIHQYHQGIIADFWAEIYRDWVIPHLQSQINGGSKWLDELSLSELQEVADKVATKQTNDKLKKMVLSGKKPTDQDKETFKMLAQSEFMKGGEKRFLEVLKDDFKNLPLDIEISIANKQKNLAETVSKLNSIFRVVFTPNGVQMLQQPGVGELLNEILEQSGLSPVNFGNMGKPVQAPVQSPLQELPVNQ